jgi:8-oxo-dGTP pyrophosphatase MutT (NUDIX family)
LDFSSRLKLLTEEKIAALLDGKRNRDAYLEIRGSDHRSATNSKCAAVLCPLVLKPDGWHMFLIRRSDLVADHRGQVAFPGGACEASDQTLEDTALREASEEIGVAPDDVRILGRLREMVTVSSYRIMPIVGTFDWPYSLTPSAEEVSRIFSIPLEWLINPENQETRTLYRSGKDVPVIYFKPFDGEILWGATARMVDNLLDILELR